MYGGYESPTNHWKRTGLEQTGLNGGEKDRCELSLRRTVEWGYGVRMAEQRRFMLGLNKCLWMLHAIEDFLGRLMQEVR